MALSIVILAAGQGKRMGSTLPKALHLLGGIPLLEHVTNAASALSPGKVYIIHGNGGDQVKAALSHLDVEWVVQDEQLGTAHAVEQALPHIPASHRVLVLFADGPLVNPVTLQKLIDTAQKDTVALVTAICKNPFGFGRIIRDKQQHVTAIVEHKDANNEQRQINEINTGILTATAQQLKDWLPQLKNDNAQKEYYLTDVIAHAVSNKISVKAVVADDPNEVLGVNTLAQLAELERFYQRQQAEKLMAQGVTIIDPSRIDVRGDVSIASDVTLDVNVVLENVTIASHCYVGPGTVLKNTTIDEHTTIESYTVIDGATVGKYCMIGPFARIRPTTGIADKAKVGNFVEVKNSSIGEGSKANHHSYLGDTTIGKDVNIGAGVITCNYDGANKHQTIIEDGVHIGADSQLIAPVTIEENATIGAGSTITTTAPKDQLTLTRAEQRSLSSWKRPTKQKDS